MEKFETGAVRDVGGKGRMDLLPMCAIMRVAKHMEDALTHYPERNWEKGLPMHSMIDSAFRHLAKYMDGWNDEDHLCAAATNLLMAMWTEEKQPDMQDIPSRRFPGDRSLCLSPRSDTADGRLAQCGHNAKEDPTEKATRLCKFYGEKEGVCLGTMDAEPCEYSGNRRRCNHVAKQG